MGCKPSTQADIVRDNFDTNVFDNDESKSFR